MGRQQPRMKLHPILSFLVLSCYATSIVALASPQRTVLVTGGAGYIGSHTCLELLNAPGGDYKVVVVDNLDNSSEESLKRVKAITGCDPKRLQFRQCDLRDKAGLKQGTMHGESNEGCARRGHNLNSHRQFSQCLMSSQKLTPVFTLLV
jgi:hypothetical protein